MTRTLHRLATATAAAGLMALVLSGCGDAPVRSGAAATVGDKRITTDALAGFVERGLKDPQAQQQLGADKAKFQRETLGRLILHELLAETARRSDVTATSGEIDAKFAEFEQQYGGPEGLVQTAAQGGVAKEDLRSFIADEVTRELVGDKVTADIDIPAAEIQAQYKQNAAQFDQVHTAHILVAAKPQADAILAQVKADPAQFATIAATSSTDTSNKDKGGDLGFAGRGQFVKEFEDAVFGAKPGDYVEVKTQFGYHVVHVIDRRTTTLEQATPRIRRTMLQGQRDQRLGELLAKIATELKIKVNPRFGRWDSTQLAVVEASAKDAVSSPAPSPGDDGGAGTQPGIDPQQGGQPGTDPQQGGQPGDPASPPSQ
ncbi:MAG: peptidylprolyl isomerase [Frankiaceae bacterium]|nr:peptidylprolyl isomerase [Frankiaceae bacterium]